MLISADTLHRNVALSTFSNIISAVPPKVQLHLGSTLKAENIKEGDDVYFECKVRANPEHHKITWRHNVSHSVSNFAPERSRYLYLYNCDSQTSKLERGDSICDSI